jgi:tRNA(Arg) A34 adenosine deaminase TadA
VRDGSENPLCFNLNLFQVKKTKIAANCRQSGEEERQSQLQGHAQTTTITEIYKKIRNSRLTSQEVYQTTVLWVIDVS